MREEFENKKTPDNNAESFSEDVDALAAELEGLAILYHSTFSEDPSQVKLFKEAYDILKEIRQNSDSDPNVAKVKQQNYLKSLNKKIEEISQLFETSADFDDESLVVDAVKENSNNEEQYASEIAELYLSGDRDAFVERDTNKIKSIQRIGEDLELVFSHLKIDEDIFKVFKNEVFKKIVKKISQLNVERGRGNDKVEKNRLRQEIQKEYDYLLSSVKDLLSKSVDVVYPPSNLEEAEDFEKAVLETVSEYLRYYEILNHGNYSDYATLPSKETIISIFGTERDIKDRRKKEMDFKEFIEKRDNLEKIINLNTLLKEEVKNIKDIENSVTLEELYDVIKRIGEFDNGKETINAALIIHAVDSIDDLVDNELRFKTDAVSAVFALEKLLDSHKDVIPIDGGVRKAVQRIFEDRLKKRFEADLGDVNQDTDRKIDAFQVEKLSTEELLALYKNSDPKVFEKVNEKGKRVYKRFPEVMDDIESVLIIAKIPEDKINDFKEEILTKYWDGTDGIKNLNSKLGGDMNKPQFATARKQLKNAIASKYGELLAAVAGILGGSKIDTVSGIPSTTADPSSPDQNAIQIDDLSRYKELRTKHLEIKDIYNKTEKEYSLALQQHYLNANSSLLGKAGIGVRNFFGLKPKLSAEAEALRQKMTKERQDYANSLNEVLSARVSANSGNKEYLADSERTKIAFVDKYIVKPNERIQKYQEVGLSNEQQKSTNRIMGFVKNNRAMIMRVGAIAVSAGIGAVSGGIGGFLSGGGIKVARMAASSLVGGAVGAGTWEYMGSKVDKARDYLEDKGNFVKGFDKSNLSESDENYLKAQRDIDKAKARQKVATVAAAAIAGGTTGLADAHFGTGQLANTMSTLTGSEGARIMVNGTEPGFRVQVEQGPITPAVEIENAPSEAVSNTASENVSKGNPSLQSAFGWQEVSEDESVTAFGIEDLKSPAQVSGNVSLSQLGFEDPLVSGQVPERIALSELGFEDPSTAEEVLPSVNEDLYEVKRGDTLSEIVNDHFKDQLDKVPAEDYNKVLYELLDKVDNSKELQESLGLRSGNIGLIYPGDKLDLSSLDSELENIINGNDGIKVNVSEAMDVKGVESSVQGTESATLSQSGFEDPVSQVTKESTTSNVLESKLPSDTLSILEKPQFTAVPTSGEYFNTTEYKNYALSVFGNEQALNKAVDQFASRVTNGSYGILDNIFGSTYEDPYKVMSSMSVKDLEGLKGNILNNFSEQAAKDFCYENNFKYETYLKWQELLDEIKEKAPYKPETTLKDLFSRHVTEMTTAELMNNKNK